MCMLILFQWMGAEFLEEILYYVLTCLPTHPPFLFPCVNEHNARCMNELGRSLAKALVCIKWRVLFADIMFASILLLLILLSFWIKHILHLTFCGYTSLFPKWNSAITVSDGVAIAAIQFIVVHSSFSPFRGLLVSPTGRSSMQGMG